MRLVLTLNEKLRSGREVFRASMVHTGTDMRRAVDAVVEYSFSRSAHFDHQSSRVIGTKVIGMVTPHADSEQEWPVVIEFEQMKENGRG